MRWIAFFLISALPLVAADAPPPAVDSVLWPPAKTLTSLRISAPRWIAGDRMVVIAEAGPQAGIAAESEATILITGPGGEVATAAAQVVSQDLKSSTVSMIRAVIETSGWSDGTARIDVSVGTAKASATAQVVSTALRTVTKDQEELAHWIQEANRPDGIWGKRPGWSRLPLALANPEHPYQDLRGMVLRSYLSPQLQRRQPYTVQVPVSLDLSRPVPAMILLHGSGGDWRNLITDEAAGQRFEQSPMLIANAGILKYREYRHLALQDVLAIIDDLATKYPVDPDRIFIQGISLGGRGALEAAALVPDRFAAVSAQGVYGLLETLMDPMAMAELDPVARQLMARADLRTWLPNLTTIPVETVIGLRDQNTPAAHGMLVADLITLQGGTAAARTFDTDHNISMPAYDWATSRRWMLEQRKQRLPLRVQQRVTCLRFGRNAWTQVTALSDYSRIGELDARWGGTAAISVTTRNLTEFELTPPATQATIVINGGTPITATGSRLRFAVTASGAELVANTPRDPGRKYPGRSGPLWDAWNDPVTYVSTGGILHEASARASAQWDLTSGAPTLPVRRLEEITAEDKASRTLIVFTDDPDHCPLLTRCGLPPVLADPGSDRVSVTLRPSPWHPERSLVVVVNRSQTPFDMNVLGMWDERLQGDWITITWPPVRGKSDVSVGVFDGDWNLGAITHEDILSKTLLGPAARGE